MNKSKYQFSQISNNYDLKQYACELCGEIYSFDEMSTCDRCQRFVCDKCSEAVVNRESNPYNYDFLCEECKKKLDNKQDDVNNLKRHNNENRKM